MYAGIITIKLRNLDGMGNSRFHIELHSKNIMLRNITVVALLGSAVGGIVFDYDHLLAWLFGISEGRFLHHPTAILCLFSLVVLSWWIKQLVSRLRGVR